ncbi:MAG: hypothetical protein ACRDZ4_04770 [Egibacteraceae bacterium]
MFAVRRIITQNDIVVSDETTVMDLDDVRAFVQTVDCRCGESLTIRQEFDPWLVPKFEEDLGG